MKRLGEKLDGKKNLAYCLEKILDPALYKTTGIKSLSANFKTK